ncbi:phospholipase A2 inhibitor and Ly6/PLAUR domain-containing protein-like [Dendrobates tinctorius]|uniref:phospholipase A2 inhibitor and Ly6/PLAUR domain-containing protein-like n=1 Tax=Dendrobates tinctorius TaxID=92724 RepID=UPI003CC9A4A3
MSCYCSSECFSGYSLSCISCTGADQAPCVGTAVTCAANEDICTSIYTETKMTMLGLTTYSHVRGCGQSSDCNIPKSLSNQFISIDLNTLCCQTDECTPTIPIAFSEKNDKNGLACPSCFTITSSTCKPDSQIQCSGNENRCTSYSISTATDPQEPIFAMTGCATENMCSNYDGHATTGTTGQMKISIECRNAMNYEGNN